MNNIQRCIGSHGELIIKMDRFPNTDLPKDLKAYEGCDFITLEKQDAEILYKWLENYVQNATGDDVIDLGMDASLAFERLYDRIVGFIYPSKTE